MQGELTSEAMLAALQAQCAAKEWIVYVEGYAYTGFAKMVAGVFEMPPAVAGVPNPAGWADIDWETQFELRAFGDRGEFHSRCLSPGRWRTRFASSAEMKEWSRRQTILAGECKEQTAGWDRLSEANGIDYWIPDGVKWVDKEDRAALWVAERIEFDEAGLAYVSDAALRLIWRAVKNPKESDCE